MNKIQMIKLIREVGIEELPINECPTCGHKKSQTLSIKSSKLIADKLVDNTSLWID